MSPQETVPPGFALVLAAVAALGAGAAARADEKPATPAPDWARVGEVLRKPGDLGADGSYKVTVLRTDPPVRGPGGMPIPAGPGLNSYAAFAGTLERATVVGDTCMLAEEPRLFFLHFQGHVLHFEGEGDAVALARAVRAAWDGLRK